MAAVMNKKSETDSEPEAAPDAEPGAVASEAAADAATAKVDITKPDPDVTKSDAGTAEDDAETTADDAEPVVDTDDDAAPRAARRTLLTRLGLGAAAVLLVVTTVLSAVLGWNWFQDRRTDSAAEAALRAAQQYAVTLTSIDASRIDQDFQAISDGATGEFKDMYTQSAQNLRPLLVEAKSVSKGQVIAASVQSATRDRVVVMLFVDAEITNATTPQPRIDRNRIVMTMQDVDGRWLASAVELQ